MCTDFNSILFRLARKADLESINSIYNQSVSRKFLTADLLSTEMDKRQVWFDNHDPLTYPVFIIEIKSKIIGWASLSRYREGRQALNTTAEISYYIASTHQRQGYGSFLVQRTITEAKLIGYNNKLIDHLYYGRSII